MAFGRPNQPPNQPSPGEAADPVEAQFQRWYKTLVNKEEVARLVLSGTPLQAWYPGTEPGEDLVQWNVVLVEKVKDASGKDVDGAMIQRRTSDRPRRQGDVDPYMRTEHVTLRDLVQYNKGQKVQK